MILSSILVVILGLAYAFIFESSQLVQGLLLSVMLGSLGGGLAYLIVKHSRQGCTGGNGLSPRSTAACAHRPQIAAPQQPSQPLPRHTFKPRLVARLSAVSEKVTASSQRSSQQLGRLASSGVGLLLCRPQRSSASSGARFSVRSESSDPSTPNDSRRASTTPSGCSSSPESTSQRGSTDSVGWRQRAGKLKGAHKCGAVESRLQKGGSLLSVEL